MEYQKEREMRREMEERLFRYQHLKQQIIEKGGEEALPGRIEIKMSRNKPYFYLLPENAKPGDKGRRIKDPQQGWVRGMLQKAFEKVLLALLDKRIAQFERILKTYEDDEIQQIFLKLSPARRMLVTPLEMDLETWASQTFPPNPSYPENKIIVTNRGELVRSKAEKILADLFYDLGIVYFYEKPLLLGNKIYYPDFTFFLPGFQKEIYWEHFGMMDNPAYAKQAILKMQDYARYGILEGDRLITTFETDTVPLNVDWAKQLAQRYILQR